MMKTTPRIYIVEDDDSVRTALGRLMETGGYVTQAFSSAESFLESVPTDAQGVLILDVRLPGMNGFQLQVMLKALWSLLEVILITGYANEGDRESAMAAGVKGFLEKPFSERSLSELWELAESGMCGRG